LLRENALCPVCHSWFYRKHGTRTIYDKPECRKIGRSIHASRRRRQAKEVTSP
jgi:hypothetical protein